VQACTSMYAVRMVMFSTKSMNPIVGVLQLLAAAKLIVI
jgi:hypothetical protein